MTTTAQQAELHGAAAWYRQAYPDTSEWVEDVDRRCWDVLVAYEAIHNLTTHMLPDGGIRRCGDGISFFTRGPLSTFDFDELTRLVVAAHRYGCRVQIANDDLIAARENLHDPENGHFAEYGPARDYNYEPGWPAHASPGLVTSCGAESDDRPDGETVACHRLIRRLAVEAPWQHDYGDSGPLGPHTPEPEDLEFEPLHGFLTVTVHPRTLDQTAHVFRRHPGLDQLAALVLR